MPRIYCVNNHVSNDYTTSTLTGPEQQDLFHGGGINDFACDDERLAALTSQLNGFDDVDWYNYTNVAVVSGGSLNGSTNDLVLPRVKGDLIVVITPGVLGATITGIAGGYADRRVAILNGSTNISLGIALSHQSDSSNGGNRMILPGLGGVTVGAAGCQQLIYDGSASRWRAAS